MKMKAITIAVTLASVASIFSVAAYNKNQIEQAAQQPAAVKTSQFPDVAVVDIMRGHYQATVTGHGEGLPRYQLVLTSEVSGRVEKLADSFVTGLTLKEGDALVQLDTTAYRQAVAAAEAAVADTRLALLEEQRQGEQARLEWQHSGLKGKPDSPLVLREPQLQAAKSSLKKAEQELVKAQNDLKKTQIKAPFDTLVVSRDVQPGSYVQAGSVIATLYSIDRLEIEVPLSAYQWANLPPVATLGKEKWPVSLTNTEHTTHWQGYVDRVEQHLDNKSRQRSVVVVVDKPLEHDEPLYPGTFVTAQIRGKALEGLWKVPASAISQNGELWFVSGENTLARVKADKRYEAGDYAYIVPPTDMDSARIVVRPLNSYVAGMRVSPKVEG